MSGTVLGGTLGAGQLALAIGFARLGGLGLALALGDLLNLLALLDGLLGSGLLMLMLLVGIRTGHVGGSGNHATGGRSGTRDGRVDVGGVVARGGLDMGGHAGLGTGRVRHALGRVILGGQQLLLED